VTTHYPQGTISSPTPITSLGDHLLLRATSLLGGLFNFPVVEAPLLPSASVCTHIPTQFLFH